MNGSKWADHVITAVREKNGVITDLKIADDTYFADPNECIVSLSDILSRLNSGKTIVTVHKDYTGKYRKGSNVEKYSYNGKDYIRSDPNQKTVDNLDNLPRF